ncbi:MAG: hypothetical protein COA73_07855 [Candidatus Hydrogenedentota bacterium]|nr:MAG: hypothetical protein COA73_07855 [Candidatus Hydrogenedentota bacterium]
MNIGGAVFGPAIVAGLIWLAVFRLWRRKSIHDKGHWGGALALGTGIIAGYIALLGVPPLKPSQAVDWLPYMSAVAVIGGVGQPWWGRKWFTFIPVLFLLAAIVLSIQLQNKIRYSWDGIEIAIWIGGLAGAVSLVGWNLERVADRRTGVSMPLAMWTWCAMGSVLLVLSGSALLGQIMGGLAAVFGAAVVLAWWNKGFTLTQGAMSVLALLYGSLLAQGYFYAETPMVSAVLAAGAPLVLWYGERRKVFYSAPFKAALWRMLYIAVPMGIALLVAGYFYSQSGSGGEYDYYSY